MPEACQRAAMHGDDWVAVFKLHFCQREIGSRRGALDYQGEDAMWQLMNWLRGSVGVLLVAVLTGCANFYVDSNTKDVEMSQFRKTEPPHPVQLVFEFQTKGVANATATALLKPRAFETVKATGVFTDVVETPVAEGALLSISLNRRSLTATSARSITFRPVRPRPSREKLATPSTPRSVRLLRPPTVCRLPAPRKPSTP
jgi:hypothetical protein